MKPTPPAAEIESKPMLPSCPLRPEHPPSLLRWFSAARDNPLSLWSKGAYIEPLLQRRLPGRRLFVLNSPRWVQQVLASKAGIYRKSEETRRALRPLIGDSLFISEGDLWQRQRRLLTPGLIHRREIPEFAAVMIPAIRESIERWLSLGEETELELTLEATRVAADVVGRTLFSFPLADRADTIYHAFNDYQDTLGRLDVAGLLGAPQWLPRRGRRRALAAVAELDRMVDVIIAAHRERPTPRGDMLDRILHADLWTQGDPLPERLARDELMLALLAGHETTANALCWAFYLLSLFPAARGRLEQEVDRELGGRPPAFDDIERLHYTRAVVQETLRLYPPIYQFAREPMQADHFGPHPVPAGSLVTISSWLIHRHHRYWKEPDTFRPERFLEPATRRRSRYHYIPFGAGTRICPGAAFATTELTLILAMTAQKMRLNLRPGHPVEPLGRLTLRPRHGLPMRLERR